MSNAVLKAEVKEKSGKGAARALRRDGKVPAIIYSNKSNPKSVAVSLRDVTVEYNRGHFRNRLLEIDLGKEKITVLPKELQFHPVSDIIEHVDFLKVEKGEELRVKVPVQYRGRERCVGIKLGGVLNIVRREIEFYAKPEAIPSHIEVSIQELAIGESLHIGSVKLPDGVTPVLKHDFTLATITGRTKEEPTAAEAEAAAADAPAEPEVTTAKAPAEEKAAEGKKD